jgi:hypothetical protein
MPKNVGVLVMVLNCTLLNVLICGCIDCKIMHVLYNINNGIGRFCTDADDVSLMKTMVCVIMLPEAVTLRAYNVDVTVSDPTEGNE